MEDSAPGILYGSSMQGPSQLASPGPPRHHLGAALWRTLHRARRPAVFSPGPLRKSRGSGCRCGAGLGAPASETLGCTAVHPTLRADGVGGLTLQQDGHGLQGAPHAPPPAGPPLLPLGNSWGRAFLPSSGTQPQCRPQGRPSLTPHPRPATAPSNQGKAARRWPDRPRPGLRGGRPGCAGPHFRFCPRGSRGCGR